MRRVFVVLLAVFMISGAGVASATGRSSSAGAHRYLIYWDQNEQEDYQSSAGAQGQLIPPWNPNGQMCLLPDGTGRFTTGYNPTTDPSNPGYLKPAMQPPVGEALWDSHGNFTGQTAFVPGPYTFPGQTVGGDIPPDSSGQFNSNGTMTGCAVDQHGNLFASDLGTAQGQFPSPDDGRVIEWFAPAYTTYCIVIGPTAGGVGPHHVDGTGGLPQPGDLAFDQKGNLLVPVVGTQKTGVFSGRVLKLHHRSLPQSASDCGPDGVYPRNRLRHTVFIQGGQSLMPFPQSIAHDPTCDCWAVASTIGNPAIAWFDNHGHQVTSKGVVKGEDISKTGSNPNGWNPFGVAFAPDGTLYFVDIHITCSAPLQNCGPQDGGGRVMKVTFTSGKPNKPTPIATGYSFPTSVTVCVPHLQSCPLPAGHHT